VPYLFLLSPLRHHHAKLGFTSKVSLNNALLPVGSRKDGKKVKGLIQNFTRRAGDILPRDTETVADFSYATALIQFNGTLGSVEAR
jgi:hypothetical protein